MMLVARSSNRAVQGVRRCAAATQQEVLEEHHELLVNAQFMAEDEER